MTSITKRVEVVDTHFGQTVTDPYRWLEADLHSNAEVAAWVFEQSRITETYLSELPGRSVLRQRLNALFDHERLTAPLKRGRRYFYTRHAGLDKQPTLIVREGPTSLARVLIDPAAWSQDGSSALAEWAPSPDGSYVAFARQESGTDWRTLCVLKVDCGEILEDKVKWARFTNIAWSGDGKGFFYSRFPEPDMDVTTTARIAGHAVYFHTLGTPQIDDRLVYSTPDQPHLVHVANVTDDGSYATIYSSPGSGGSVPTVLDLRTPDWKPRALVFDFENYWTIVGNIGSRLVMFTQQDAPRGKIVTLDLDDPEAVFSDLITEQAAVLNDTALLGGRLIVSYLVDAQTRIERYLLDGTPDGTVALPSIGSAGGFCGNASDPESFFVFTSYDAPTTIFRYDIDADERTAWAKTKYSTDLDRIVVEQRFFASSDGTRVPMFTIRRKDVTSPAATLLTAYGGYGISNVPVFSPAQLAWVEQGGVFAVANIRGGGEYGKQWHDAGRLLNKQNSFDDFIAAGEHLIAESITPLHGLAIQGESNGGLLVGAVVNQRPDLFAAALPCVGVMDMLRFDRFSGGALWVSEFGDPAQETDFRNLLRYSPYHNIRASTAYPAILVTTADTDNRVVPAHSFKYVAALQAADLGPRPQLLRIDSRAGHGSGKPIDQALDEIADMWAFAARWTGLDLTRVEES